MTLHTDLAGFLVEHKARLAESPVYVAVRASQTIVTSALADKGVLLVTQTKTPRSAVEATLRSAGIEPREGLWMEDGSPLVEHHPTWVAGVTYRGEGGLPGIWMDAWSLHPSEGDVLSRLYAEFLHDGVITDIGVDEFMRAAQTKVVILTPQDLIGFVEKNSADF